MYYFDPLITVYYLLPVMFEVTAELGAQITLSAQELKAVNRMQMKVDYMSKINIFDDIQAVFVHKAGHSFLHYILDVIKTSFSSE